jgi:TetR/AcrR family transcriptional regulator
MKNSPPHPHSRPRRAGSAASRATILAAAEREFARSGLAGARTDAIAAAAGVNKALLYYYFKSKQDLYEAVVDEQFQEFNRQALEVLNSTGSARAVLLCYVNLHFDFISTRHRLAPLFQQLLTTGGKPLERLVRQYFVPRSQAFRKLLERGMREGEFRQVDGFHTAISIIALIVFYFSASPVLQLFGHSDPYSAANLQFRKQQVLDFIRYALFADPEAPLP